MGSYDTARRSTIRLIKDTIETLPEGIGFIDWDAAAQNLELPSQDLIGLVGFSFTENAKFFDITFGVGIMVHDDPGLSRMTKYLDVFFDRLKAEQQFHIYNDQGVATSQVAVIFDGTAVTPMARVDFRPVQTVECSGRIVPIGRSS